MDISKQYQKACEAVERGNDDYAIQLLQDVLSIRPDHLESRQMLRETVRKKFRKAGLKSAGAAAYLKGLLPLIKMHVFSLAKKPDQAMIEAEKFLALDPENPLALTVLGNAATKMPNCNDTAIWAFESIRANKPANVRALHKLGRLYEEIDDVQKATECYEQILRVRPTEREVETKLRDLAARKTIKAGWDKVGTKGNFKEVLRDSEQMDDRSGEEQVIRSETDLERNITRVLKDLEDEPNNKQYVVQLGDLYRRAGRYDEAMEQYRKGKQIDERDYAIDERMGDMKLEILHNGIEEIKDAARKGKAEAGVDERIEKLQTYYDKLATEEYSKRVKLRPTDLPLRYRLGRLLYDAGKIDDALAEFQQAVKAPQHRRSALTFCGMCLYKKGMYDMAVQMYEDAVKGAVTTGRDEMNILYNLGLAADKLGDLAKAETAFKQIFNSDINFRDVKARIEDIYRKRKAAESASQPRQAEEAS